MRRLIRRLPSWALAVLALALGAGELPVVHEHEGPGLYDETCGLDRLATPPAASIGSAAVEVVRAVAPPFAPPRPASVPPRVVPAGVSARGPPPAA